jgi:transposase
MKLHVFCFDLPQSDACFKADPAGIMEAFLDGHVTAFAFFGGVRPRFGAALPRWLKFGWRSFRGA